MEHLSESERTFCILAEMGAWNGIPKKIMRYHELMKRKRPPSSSTPTPAPKKSLNAEIISKPSRSSRKEYNISFTDATPWSGGVTAPPVVSSRRGGGAGGSRPRGRAATPRVSGVIT